MKEQQKQYKKEKKRLLFLNGQRTTTNHYHYYYHNCSHNCYWHQSCHPRLQDFIFVLTGKENLLAVTQMTNTNIHIGPDTDARYTHKPTHTSTNTRLHTHACTFTHTPTYALAHIHTHIYTPICRTGEITFDCSLPTMLQSPAGMLSGNRAIQNHMYHS